MNIIVRSVIPALLFGSKDHVDIVRHELARGLRRDGCLCFHH